MATEQIGRFDKPEVGNVLEKRKLYIVALVHQMPGAPDGYATRLSKYWSAVDEHVSRLEAKAGMVKRIFHEGVGQSGDAAIDRLKQVNIAAYPLVKGRVESGASFEDFEDDDLFLEYLDWGRCMQIGFASPKVAEAVSQAFTRINEQRVENMSKTLETALGAGEAGLLIASSTQGLNIPEDVEKFSIMPPELDELMRWIESTTRNLSEVPTTNDQRETAEQNEISTENERSEESGLWTPN